MSSRQSQGTARVTVSLPGSADRLSGALLGAYGRDRELPAEMAALLKEIDRKTGH